VVEDLWLIQLPLAVFSNFIRRNQKILCFYNKRTMNFHCRR
jgi:hypothetical protein